MKDTTENFFHTSSVDINFRGLFLGYAVRLNEDLLMLCVEGEVVVFLSEEDLLKARSPEAWQMFLIAKGMLNPLAVSLGEWLWKVQVGARFLAFSGLLDCKNLQISADSDEEEAPVENNNNNQDTNQNEN